MKADIVIVGGGPSGLCFAASLRNLPLRIVLVDRLPRETLADPPYDGREIALTQKSAKLLRELEVWEKLPSAEISELRGARVLNGTSLQGLELGPGRASARELGFLLSNHLIRRAAWETVQGQANLTIVAGARVSSVASDEYGARVNLDTDEVLDARLVVAADTRFSETRRAIGIPAKHEDFGRTMLVFRMDHEVPHDHVAWEWFGERQTLALLPMNGNRASVVLTLPHAEIERMRAMPKEAFEADLERRFLHRLGRMSLASERFAYPLVAVYPDRFYASHYVTIGDAAVGMHPVTAHGFNFGLSGACALARLIGRASARGADIASPHLLRRYYFEHRHATRPLFLATNAIARLYVAESLPARALRGALLRFASRTPPVGRLLSAALMQGGARR